MWRSIVVLVAVSGVGCVQPATRLEVTGAPVATGCTVVQGSQLGQLPLELRVGDAEVRFLEWTLADAEASRFFGFALEAPAHVVFTVQAGARTFTSSAARWVHPAGLLGPRVEAIDRITLCTRDAPRAPLALR